MPVTSAATPGSVPVASTPASTISVHGLAKAFVRPDGTKVRAVDHIDLEVHDGELLVLLGPSGCGKTTLLRLMAGLEDADGGQISVGGTSVLDVERGLAVPTHLRPISMVFQSYALWPHMTALGNVIYPIRNAGAGKRDAEETARDALQTVGVLEVANQYPNQMSGGQQQRVALARALVGKNQAILFDEPLSNVDAKVRERLRLEIVEMQARLGFTAVYVTHDQEEAMTLGTRIAVLREGKIEQLGTPTEIYDQPVSPYVARFVGTINDIPGRVCSAAGTEMVVDCSLGKIVVSRRQAHAVGDAMVLMIRPEVIRTYRDTSELPSLDGANVLTGTVEASLYLGGARFEYVVRVGDARLVVWQHGGERRPQDSKVCLVVDPSDVHLFEN